MNTVSEELFYLQWYYFHHCIQPSGYRQIEYCIQKNYAICNVIIFFTVYSIFLLNTVYKILHYIQQNSAINSENTLCIATAYLNADCNLEYIVCISHQSTPVIANAKIIHYAKHVNSGGFPRTNQAGYNFLHILHCVCSA